MGTRYHRSSRVVQGMPYWLVGLLVVILVVAAATVVILAQKKQLPSEPPATAARSGDSEVDRVAAKLSKLIELPRGEAPTLIEVKDQSKLKNLAFLNQASTGDQVLIYQKAQKGFIYRPSTGRLVGAGHVAVE